MSKRKREDAFVDQLAETLLSDTDRDLDSLNEPQLHKLFLNAIAALPSSKLQKSLQKRAAVHAQALLLRIQQRAKPAAVKETTPAAKRSRRTASTAVNFLHLDTALEAALSAKTAQLPKLTAASLGHPALAERLCETSADGLAAGLQADFVAGRNVRAGSISALLGQLSSSELGVGKNCDWRTSPEWKLFQRGFELVAVAGPDGDVAEECVRLCARYMEWSTAVAKDEALPHAVMLAGMHLAMQPSMLVQLLLADGVPCEDACLRPLVRLVLGSLEGAIELAPYQAVLQLHARLRSRKANATMVGEFRSAVPKCNPPAGFAQWVSKGKFDLMSLDEKELEETLDDYEEEPEEALAAAGGGFFLDVGVTQATKQLGEEDETEEHSNPLYNEIGEDLDNLDNDDDSE